MCRIADRTARPRRPHDGGVGRSGGPSAKREAIAQIDLGSALTHLGSLDEAVAHGRQALCARRVVNSVLPRAGELDRALMTCFPRESLVQDFHEQYQQLTTQANAERT